VEKLASRLTVANEAAHRARSDACLVIDAFLASLQGIPTVSIIAAVMSVAQPLTFAEALVFAIAPPAGFEVLTPALSERCAITIVYADGSQRPGPRKVAPRFVLEVRGIAYVLAPCHRSDAERTFPRRMACRLSGSCADLVWCAQRGRIKSGHSRQSARSQ
jgi:hypothetical protein